MAIMAFPFLSKWPLVILLTYFGEDDQLVQFLFEFPDDIYCLCYHRYCEELTNSGKKSKKEQRTRSQMHCDSALTGFAV